MTGQSRANPPIGSSSGKPADLPGAGPLPLDLLPDSAQFGRDGRLSVAACDLVDLAGEFGTPLVVYDEDHIRARCRDAVEVFGDDAAAYAVKAFTCRAMIRLAHEEGMLLNVATGGELHAALSADFPADRVVMHGSNKSRRELADALRAGVGRIVVEGFDELSLLDHVARDLRCRPSVLVRVTPDVRPPTHPYISTSGADSRFGFTISSGAAERAVKQARASGSMNLVGIHAHIGSQILELDPFRQTVAALGDFINSLDRPDELEELWVGGGLGVAYEAGQQAPSISQWGSSILSAATAAGINGRVCAEPGRSVVAQAAVALYTVGTVKEVPGLGTYVAVDGGLTDNPRPAMYGSRYEAFLPRSVVTERDWNATVIGKLCESGDVLIRDAHLPHDLEVGDVLGIPVAGAYSYAMASNYIKMPRPAVVFVRDGESRPVIRRETYEDLLRLDL